LPGEDGPRPTEVAPQPRRRQPPPDAPVEGQLTFDDGPG
jgi:hypothetical protein